MKDLFAIEDNIFIDGKDIWIIIKNHPIKYKDMKVKIIVILIIEKA